jgi:hypothetical protein
MNLIKLTDSRGYTRNKTHWEIGSKLSLPYTSKPKLCTTDVIHAYKSLNLALLVNPTHASFKDPKIFEAIGKIVVEDPLKVGCFELKITKEIEQPSWYKDTKTKRKVQLQFAILCAKEVLPMFEKRYPNDLRPRKAIEVAEKVLKSSFKDKSAAVHAADAAAAATNAAARAGAIAAVYVAAAHAAHAAAADAAYAAARAAAGAGGYADANAVYAAADAAYAAADAAYAANKNIDFNKLANKAVELQGENQ